MKYIIKTFQDEGDEKRVGFEVEDSKGNKFAIDKVVPKSGTDEEIVSAAQAAAQPEIDDWQAQFAVIGKVWDAEAGKLVEIVPEPEPTPEPVESTPEPEPTNDAGVHVEPTEPFVPDTPLVDPAAEPVTTE